MLEYLNQYGNVSLAQAPLNDVDLAIFAELVYCPVEQIAHPEGLSLKELSLAMEKPGEQDVTQVRFSYQMRDQQRLREALARAQRYDGVRIKAFRCTFDDPGQIQFAALALEAEGDAIVIYRGTDNTLAGWKEDFNLAYMERIPAQEMAVSFLEEMLEDANAGRVCGHSKGGNLALYAAARCREEIRAKIQCVLSLDGPGLHESVIGSAGYARVADRLRLIIPRASLVGLLFEQPESVRIVESTVLGLHQHDPMTWKTSGMDFLNARDQTRTGKLLGQAVRRLIDRMPVEMREDFVEAIYEIIRATGAETVNDLVRGWLKNTVPVMRQRYHSDPEKYEVIQKTALLFWLSAAETFGEALPDRLQQQLRERLSK